MYTYADNSWTISICSMLPTLSKHTIASFVEQSHDTSEGSWCSEEQRRLGLMERKEDTSTQANYSYTLLCDQDAQSEPMLQPSAPMEANYYQQPIPLQPSAQTGLQYYPQAPYPAVSGSIAWCHCNTVRIMTLLYTAANGLGQGSAAHSGDAAGDKVH